jgi:dipeptidyl aminopeptidase/acylaminoacyl peptidase
MNVRLCVSLAAALLLAAVARAEPPPATAFARLPAIESVELSPNGQRIAHLMHKGDKTYLIVRNASDFAVVTGVDIQEVKARRLRWATDDVVILIVSNSTSVYGVRGDVELTAPFAVDLSNLAKGPSIKPLMVHEARAVSGSIIRRTDAPAETASRILTDKARIIGVDSATGEVLIPDLVGEDLGLFAVDPKTSHRRQVGFGQKSTYDWVVDDKGAPFIRIDYQEVRDHFAISAVQDGAWRKIVQETAAVPSMEVYGLDAEGRVIVGTRFSNPGRYGLYVLSLETGKLAPYFVDGTYDVGDVDVDPYTNRVVGVGVDAELPKAIWFDKTIGEQQKLVEASFKGAPVRLLSWSRDRKHFIAEVDTDEEPPAYYIYDAETKKLREIGSAYPEAEKAALAPRLSMLYPARDKVQIPAYLTMADGLPRPAPLIVLPHGGPEDRDIGGFDWLAHFLGSRGYIVLQPNFRGSSGYGDAWRDAGRGEWGIGVMQNDVTDGVKALVAGGYADPKRVCIVGASYGGYAALAGAVFTPDLYRCAVAIAPVSDLSEMIDYERDRHGRESWVVDYWKRVMGGDMGAHHDRLAAMSPASHAASVRAPILLIHGKDDSVVPIEQSRGMKRALEHEGKSVQLIELKSEDHYLSRADTRQQTLEALDQFLSENLKK